MSEEKGIRLEFAQFGHFDSFEVFRSLTSMIGLADHELPAPIATGLKTMRFIDQINLKSVLDRDLYYRVRVIRGNQSLLSDELQTYISTFSAPQNLIVTFSNNALEIEWDFESVTELHYYCSEFPIDPLNLPVPKAVLAGDVRTYVDIDIEVGKTYYVRVGSVKNGVEKISSQAICDADIFKINTTLINTIQESGTLSAHWINNADVFIDSEGAHFNTLQKYLQCATTIDFNSNFKITLEIKFNSFTRPAGVPAGDSAFEIFTNADQQLTTSSRVFGISAICDGNNWGGVDRSLYFGVSNVWALATTKALNIGQWYNVEFERISSTITLKVDDELVGTKTSPASITNRNSLRIGSTQRFSNGYGNYTIRRLKIK